MLRQELDESTGKGLLPPTSRLGRGLGFFEQILLSRGRCLSEARLGGSQADGVGYSNCNGGPPPRYVFAPGKCGDRHLIC